MKSYIKPLLSLVLILTVYSCGDSCTIEFSEDDAFSSSVIITNGLTDDDLCKIKTNIENRMKELAEDSEAYESISFEELRAKKSNEVQAVLDQMRGLDSESAEYEALLDKLGSMDQTPEAYYILHSFKAKNGLGVLSSFTYFFTLDPADDYAVLYESEYD